MAKTKPSDKNVVGTSLLVSVSDVLLNLLVGLFTGSTAVIAQSLQGFSDLTTAGILYMGVLRSKKKADKLHPLGYGREIFFWVLIAGMLMFVGTGAFTLYLGFQQFINPGQIDNVGLAFIMLSFGLVTNYYAFSKSVRRIKHTTSKRSLWRQFRDSPMIETKSTFIVDFLVSLSALFGFVALSVYVITGDVRFDGVGGMLVGGSMMTAAVILVLDVRDLIVGKSAPIWVVRKIRSAALSHPEVEEILDLRTIYLGSSKIMVLLEIHLNENLTTNQIEKLIDRIRVDIKRKVPHAYHLQIEVETPDHELI